jgi:arylsulfatase A-like enzyme
MRALLPTLFAAALLGCGGGDETAAPAPEADPARNLLLISLDTTRADRLGCYGYESPTSPSLDALAAQGMRFTSAWTPMPITLPAHSSMLTSRHPRGLGVTSNFDALPAQESTLAERLAAQGFATGGFVSAPVLMAESGLGQGFDTYEFPRVGTRRAAEIYTAARNWIAEHRDERFFCFVHHYDPHAGYDPPEPHLSRFGVGEHERNKNPPWGVMNFMREPELLTDEVIDQASRAYDAEIAYTDAQIGLLIEDLRLAGLLDETLVVVVADHGETHDELSERYGYAYDHGEFLYPREIRVPLLLRGPERLGLRGGRTLDASVCLTDLMPTALELLGVPCESPYEGRSLVPLLRGGEVTPVPIVSQRHRIEGDLPHASLAGDEHAIVYGRWLLIESDGRGRELYDLETDPNATTNIAEEESDRAERLVEFLGYWLEDHPAGALAVPQEISDERRQALGELGYASGG